MEYLLGEKSGICEREKMVWTPSRDVDGRAGFVRACRRDTNTDKAKDCSRAGDSVPPFVLTCHTRNGWQDPALLWPLGLEVGWRRHQGDQARRKEAPRKLKEWGRSLKCTTGGAAYPSPDPSLSHFQGIRYFLQARGNETAERRPGLTAVTVKSLLHTYCRINTKLCCL